MKFKHMLVLLIGVILLLILLLTTMQQNGAEGFVDTSNFSQMINYFHYRLATPNKYKNDTDPKNRREIPVSPDTDISQINMAFQTAGLTTKDDDVARYFFHNTNDISDADKQCRRAPNPDSAAPSASCGWWFVSDPAFPSTAAYGTEAGPEDTKLSNKFPGGRWIWDREEAVRMESLKRCKRIRTCQAIDPATGCAFCENLGHGIPINPNGTVKYPHEPDGACGSYQASDGAGGTTSFSYIRRTPAECPRITYNLDLTSYDYNYDANGNVAEGEQTDLMRLVQANGTTQTAQLCTTTGPLTKECRISLFESYGFSDKGAAYRIINTESGVTSEAGHVCD
jgi:hypothetical protein